MTSIFLYRRRVAPVLASALLAALAIALPSRLVAQDGQPAVSGTIVGQYDYVLGGPREGANQFTINRAYLTIRGTPAPRLSFRLTSDVYQSGDQNGWSVRLKYAYLDYRLGTGDWATALRAGMLQTVTIEQQEGFWPRWLGSVPLDRHGYFQSADVGVAARTSLPRKFGELYAHVVNGSGYSRRETDRFKDVGLRASITPFAGSTNALLASAMLTAWTYQGAVASSEPDDPVAPVPAGLERDRWGLHAGVKSPRLTAAVEHSHRTDEVESGSPSVVASDEGTITSGFVILRPFPPGARRAPRFGLVGRYDAVDPTTRADRAYHYLIAGGLYDVNDRLSLSMTYQELLGSSAPSAFRSAVGSVAVTF